MSENQHILRSLMFVPGHNERIWDSAAKSNADALLFDLEDAVQPAENKLKARDVIVRRTQEPAYDRFSKFVRVNEISSEFFLQDIISMCKAKIDGFLLPMIETEDDVKYLDSLLGSIEREAGIAQGTFSIIPILETTLSIVNCVEIARASNRNIAIGFGSADYVSDLQGVRDFETNLSISHPRAHVAMVARAYRLEAIDAAYIKVHDLDGLENHVNTGKTLGYGGMWVLHPKQNELVNRIYAPSKEDYDQALAAIELFEEAKKLNKGVAIIDGKFIGPPLIVKAEKIIKRVEQMKNSGKQIFM